MLCPQLDTFAVRLVPTPRPIRQTSARRQISGIEVTLQESQVTPVQALALRLEVGQPTPSPVMAGPALITPAGSSAGMRTKMQNRGWNSTWGICGRAQMRGTSIKTEFLVLAW